jgi:hypothetical protein
MATENKTNKRLLYLTFCIAFKNFLIPQPQKSEIKKCPIRGIAKNTYQYSLHFYMTPFITLTFARAIHECSVATTPDFFMVYLNDRCTCLVELARTRSTVSVAYCQQKAEQKI